MDKSKKDKALEMLSSMKKKLNRIQEMSEDIEQACKKSAEVIKDAKSSKKEAAELGVRVPSSLDSTVNKVTAAVNNTKKIQVKAKTVTADIKKKSQHLTKILSKDDEATLEELINKRGEITDAMGKDGYVEMLLLGMYEKYQVLDEEIAKLEEKTDEVEELSEKASNDLKEDIVKFLDESDEKYKTLVDKRRSIYCLHSSLWHVNGQKATLEEVIKQWGSEYRQSCANITNNYSQFTQRTKELEDGFKEIIKPVIEKDSEWMKSMDVAHRSATFYTKYRELRDDFKKMVEVGLNAEDVRIKKEAVNITLETIKNYTSCILPIPKEFIDAFDNCYNEFCKLTNRIIKELIEDHKKTQLSKFSPRRVNTINLIKSYGEKGKSFYDKIHGKYDYFLNGGYKLQWTEKMLPPLNIK